jgi:phosphatidylglycerol:prolipoprotein diacylglycerol transferase
MAFYRIGCVLIGCCYGTPTDLPWAVIYTNPASRAPLNIPIHPTQLYHLTWNVLMFVTALILKSKLRRPGLTAQIVLIVYFLGDFIIRLFRGDDTIIAGISLSQMVAAAILLASLLTMILSGMKRLRPANP